MKIYVASSWRNSEQPGIVNLLKENGYDVYDFRHPDDNDNGFHWSEIDQNWMTWDNKNYIRGLQHDLAVKGFKKDMDALITSDVCILLLPCGRSAHLEFGYAVGANKKTIILLSEMSLEPELMNKMADYICMNSENMLNVLANMKDNHEKEKSE